MVRFFKFFIVAIFLAVFTTSDVHAAPTIDVHVAPSKGSLTTQFIVSVDLKNAGMFDKPEIIKSDDFKLKSIGTNQQVSVINGSLSSTTSYRYQAIPLREGTLKLPTFSIKTDNGVITTPTKTVEVDSSFQDSTDDRSNHVTAENTLSKSSVFSGEQVVLTTKLSTTIRLENLQMPSPSDVIYWSEQLGPPKQYKEEDLYGETVTILEQSYSLFPLIESGEVKIPAQSILAEAQIPDPQSDSLFDSLGSFGSIFRGGLFGGFGAFGLQPITVNTKPLSLNVIALPDRKSPVGKNEIPYHPVLVGATDISASLDSDVVTNNDGVTLKLVITSLGNINNLRKLSLPKLDSFESENQQENFGKTLTNNETRGIYTGLFTLYPKQNGAFEFPALELTFFNPNTGEYETVKTNPISVLVNGIDVAAPHIEESMPAASPELTPEAKIEEKNLAQKSNRLWGLMSVCVVLLVSTTLFLLRSLTQKQPRFSVPAKSNLQSYQDLVKLIDEAEKHVGPLKNQPESLSPHYQFALDIVTESKYNPTFEFDQKIFDTTRDTIMELCRLMQKPRKKPSA